MNTIESLDLYVAAVVASGPDFTVDEIIAHAAKIDAACQQFKAEQGYHRKDSGVFIPHGYQGHACHAACASHVA